MIPVVSGTVQVAEVAEDAEAAWDEVDELLSME